MYQPYDGCPSRNQIFDALFALAPTTVGDLSFVTRSRKFKGYGEVPTEEQPAFFQTEPTESSKQVSNQPYKRIWQAMWTIYFKSDKSDDEDIPARLMNDLLDAFEQNIMKVDDPDDRNTLGGLVWHCSINGEIFKIPGDDDGQGMLVIPISIMVP